VQKKAVVANAEVDPETREKLASLGYVTGGSGSVTDSGFDPKDGIQLWTTIEAAVRHAQLSEWNESEKLFRDVLKKQPDNVIAKKFLANVLRKQGKNEAAVPLLESAMKSELHQQETLLDLSETFFEMKKYPESLELLLPVVNTGRPNMRTLTLAAWLFSHFERDRDALEAYQKLSSLRPLDEQEALNAAGICLTSRDATSAEKFFQMALKANTKSSAAWKGMGLILASKQQWDKALEAFLNAGDCANAKNVLGKLSNPAPELENRLKQTCQ
jgi:tetratricopeptide (TPR) repeat protein